MQKLRVLLVDDEDFIRISFKSYIDWSRYGFEVVGEAKDGYEAIELIESLKPDIVFLDIKMPRMDGLQALSIIREKNLQSKVIVLSSYNDFEYVKKAMKSGALDYIHKPGMNAEMIVDVLMNVKTLLKNEKNSYDEFASIKQQMERDRPKLKELFLRELIEGVINLDEDYIKNNKPELGIKPANLFCIILSIDNYKTVQKRYSADKQHLISYALKNIVQKLFEHENEVDFLKYDSNVYIILKSYSSTRSIQEIRSDLHNISYKIHDALKKFLNIGVTLGISAMHNGFEDLPAAFREALMANKLKFFSSGTETICYEKDCIGDDSAAQSEKVRILDLLLELLEKNDFEAVKTSVCDFMQALIKNCKFSVKQILDIIKEVYYLLKHKHDIFKAQYEIDDSAFLPVEDILFAENVTEIMKLLSDEIDRIHELKAKNDKIGTNNSKIKKAIEYIQTNFHVDLTLEDVSASAGLNPSYFSRLFKNEIGMPLVSYINELRIERAIYYMEHTDMKNYEISERIGFKNVQYFNIMFKKITGKTPSEYKNNQK